MSSLKQQVNRFRTIIIILILVIVGLVLAMAFRENRTNRPPEQSISTVSKQTVEQIVSTDGKLAGVDERSILLAAGAQVQEVRVKNGDRVTSGQSLFLIQQSGRNVDITSPIAGIVGNVAVKSGDTITTALVAARVINDSEYRIPLAVSEAEIAQVAVGQKAKLIFSAISLDTEYDAEVVSVDPLSNPASTAVNYTVSIKPINVPENVRAGMSVDVEITTAKVENVLAIPESFLIEKEDKFFVKLINWKNENKTDYDTTEKEVTLGLQTNELVEIKSGLSENDQVLDPAYTIQRSGLFSNFSK